MNVEARDVSEGLRRLGLEGLPVCVHSSLRSFGYVHGGADAVVGGLLANSTTLMAPTFSRDSYAIAAPPGMRLERNGWDYAHQPVGNRLADRFSTHSGDVDPTMGAVPAALLRVAEHRRGDHPLCSFTAAGPLAEALIDGQRPLDVYAPLSELAERGGWVVMAGVGLDRMTLIHLAEKLAGRTLFRRWALGQNGEVIMCEVGGCSAGFERLRPVLDNTARRTTVGASRWEALPAQAVLERVADEIRRNPNITHCWNAGCIRCRDAIGGGPILESR